MRKTYSAEFKAHVLYGPVGVGKSHIAQALGHAACMRGYSAIYVKTNRLLQDLGGGHADSLVPIHETAANEGTSQGRESGT